MARWAQAAPTLRNMSEWTIQIEAEPLPLADTLERLTNELDANATATTLTTWVRESAFGASLVVNADTATEAEQHGRRLFLEALGTALDSVTPMPEIANTSVTPEPVPEL
jgi:hypothetical protein